MYKYEYDTSDDTYILCSLYLADNIARNAYVWFP